jgi:hypothetical protein
VIELPTSLIVLIGSIEQNTVIITDQVIRIRLDSIRLFIEFSVNCAWFLCTPELTDSKLSANSLDTSQQVYGRRYSDSADISTSNIHSSAIMSYSFVVYLFSVASFRPVDIMIIDDSRIPTSTSSTRSRIHFSVEAHISSICLPNTQLF